MPEVYNRADSIIRKLNKFDLKNLIFQLAETRIHDPKQAPFDMSESGQERASKQQLVEIVRWLQTMPDRDDEEAGFVIDYGIYTPLPKKKPTAKKNAYGLSEVAVALLIDARDGYFRRMDSIRRNKSPRYMGKDRSYPYPVFERVNKYLCKVNQDMVTTVYGLTAEGKKVLAEILS